MKSTPVYLLATATLGLSLASCDSSSSSSKKEASETPATAATEAATAAGASSVALPAGLKVGHWEGFINAQQKAIHFVFEVAVENNKPVVYLINKGLNGGERLRCDDVRAAGDSAVIRLHAFDAALVVRANGTDNLAGTWVKYDAKKPYRVPMTAVFGPRTEPRVQAGTPDFAGTWRTTFREEGGKTYPAVGIFQQQGAAIRGTFLTSTGDYRYLSGFALAEGGMGVSTFDGNHGFLFQAKKLPNGTLSGDFYSGKSGHETWTAVLDPTAKLPNADTLVYLKKGESRLNFKFPNVMEGGSISPTDPKYRSKVVVVQILGSWCPNCMDETNFLTPWYEKNKARGVEIIALGYERSPAYQVSAAKLRNMRTRFKIGYDVAFAGVSDKDSVARSLPQLAKFVAFPTTIFLDKKGNVRQIHTGFSGPGTGKYYQEEIAGFNREIDKLLQEQE